MFKNSKRLKSIPLALSIALITNSALLTNVYANSNQKTEIKLKSDNNTTDKNKNELIVDLLYPSIKNQINSYYKDYFNIDLEVFSYENSLVSVKKDSYLLEVTVDVVPQIGPHNPVGLDRITFTVGIFGEPKLKNYEHIKSYKIPEIYKDYIIKPLPNIEK